MHYLIYFHSDSGDTSTHKAFLMETFGDDNVYVPNGANIFVIRAPLPLETVMEKLGFNEEKQKSGVVSRIEQDGINGWFASTLWAFLRSPAQNS